MTPTSLTLQCLQRLLWPQGLFVGRHSAARQPSNNLDSASAHAATSAHAHGSHSGVPPPPPRQTLPSEFVPKPDTSKDAQRTRDALRAALVEVLPGLLREQVANNSRLKSIQMPEVVSQKDHRAACTLVFEMMQSPELMQVLLLSVLQHTLGMMFPSTHDMFEAALWMRNHKADKQR